MMHEKKQASLSFAAVRMPLVLLGGIKSRADLDAAMREGFEPVAMGQG
jgi:hypothetical protein